MAKVATFLIMAVVWVILSGMLDPFHLTLGVICCGLIAHFSHGLLFWGGDAKSWLRGIARWILYIPSLFWEIILANIHVIRVVVHPRMLEIIDPQVIHFRTILKRPISKVTLAQSITLTPGTITVDIRDDEFTVHALDRTVAEGCPGAMEERIRKALEADR
ncbi:MAG: Na+/H+ antiporter subunit E [Syntrophaceae bacterium]